MPEFHRIISCQEKRSCWRSCADFPAPRDFTWEELVTLMRQAAFTEHCDGGSHYLFEHPGGFRFSMSRTHPSGVLKHYQINDAKAALDAVGVNARSKYEQG
jgi:hypothetical protein